MEAPGRVDMKKTFFYIAAGKLRDGTFKTKVGISDNPEKRIRALRSADYMLDLFAVLKFEDLDVPRRIEKACCERFKKLRWSESFWAGENLAVVRNRREYFGVAPSIMLKFALSQIPGDVAVVRVT